MGFYNRYILPHMINCACGGGAIRWERKNIVPKASGRVLEVGFGSGHNLPYYAPGRVERLFALEPDPHIRKLAEPRARDVDFPIDYLDLPGEQIPLEDASVDDVVITFTLCTIPDAQAALEQIRRVLKPGGRMLFAEHGLAPDRSVRKWQNRLDGLWGKIAGGCHLNREMVPLIESSGFEMTELHQDYARKTPKWGGYISRGVARPR